MNGFSVMNKVKLKEEDKAGTKYIDVPLIKLKEVDNERIKKCDRSITETRRK